MTATLLRNVRLFDGTGSPPRPAHVRVEGNRIAAVLPAEAPAPAGDAEVIEAGGAFLMPGMVNCHAHPSYLDIGDMYALGEVPIEEHVLGTMHNVRTMLDHGYTAAVSGASAKHRIDLVIRNEIAAGRIPGPRLRACTPEITVTGGLGDVRQMHLHHDLTGVVLDGPEAIRTYVRTLIREGVDSVKLMISGDNFVRTGTADMTLMEPDEIDAACRVARAHGRRIIAHARTAQSVKLALAGGCDLVYHANFCDTEALDLLEAARDRVFVNPAIGLSYAALHEMGDYGIDRDTAELWGFRHELEGALETMQALRKRGVRVLPFGDYGFRWNRLGDDARDLEHFVALAGFTPAEALVAATKHGGECFGERLGVIAEGWLADLLLVDGDPLADLALLRDPAKLLLVMQDGRIHRRAPGH